MSESYLKLKDRLMAREGLDELATRCSMASLELLVAIASSSSESEWEAFAQAGFSMDAMPPILLTGNQMQVLRGGGLPSLAALMGDVED